MSTSAQRVCVQSKKITAEGRVPPKLPPTGRRPTFTVPAQSGTVVVGHPPKNSVDGAGSQRKMLASSTHSSGPAPLLYEDYVHGRIESMAVLPPWPCVATPSPRR
jgi:hypothetical protein